MSELGKMDCSVPPPHLQPPIKCAPAIDCRALHSHIDQIAAKMFFASKRKKELLVSALGLLSLNLLIHFDIFRLPFFEPNSAQRDGHFDANDAAFHGALLDAVEALEYMYDAQIGRAKVAEAVEKPIDVEEIGGHCSGRDGSEENVAKGRKWTASGDFHLFSAYLDQRSSGLFPVGIPIVRIIASSFGTTNQTYFCHFRFYNEDKGWTGNIVKAHIRWIWQRAWDPRNEFYNTYLISCPLLLQRKSNKGKNAVLVTKSRHCINIGNANFTQIIGLPKNVMKETSVLGLKPHEIRIAVCVKGLAFLDNSELSARWILEWVELQWALGASSVGIYVYWVPDQVRLMLEKLAKMGRVELINLELPGDSPNQPMSRHQFIWRNRQQKRRHELVPYNDCFQRYSQSHHFVLILDTDEVIVPLGPHPNWQSMLANVLKGRWRANPSSISIRNVFKFRANQSEESLFENRQRSNVVQERDQYGKSFISTRSVVTVFNHFALHRLHENVSNTFFVNENEALKLHWKRKCPNLELGDELCAKIEKNMIEDDLLLAIRRRVEMAVKRIISN